MRIVLDTNILVRANAKAKGPARELLLLIVSSREHVLLLSPFLLKELERVFGYSRSQSLANVSLFEVWEIGKQPFDRPASRNRLDDHSDRHPHSSNARLHRP